MKALKAWRVVALTTVALAAAFAPVAKACDPTTVALPHPQGFEFGEVLVLGPSGLIGGTAAHEDPHTGIYDQVSVLWRDGRPSGVGDVPLSPLADLNSRGDILITGGEFPSGRAVLISNGIARKLPGLGGDFVYARRLNDRGDAVGSATFEDGAEAPVIWRRGRRASLCRCLPAPRAASRRGSTSAAPPPTHGDDLITAAS